MSNFQNICQNAVKDEASFNQFINQQFNNFFSQFNAFLIQYQFPNASKHQNQGVFKKKKILSTFDDVLGHVKTIISKTQKNNYSPTFKLDIKDVFTCLLHPLTPDKIRQSSIPIFYILIEKLGDHAYEMLQDVSRFVFDFTIIRNECSRESNLDNIVDQKKCISIPGMENTNKEQLFKNIEEFENLMLNAKEPGYSHLFPFFKKMLLIPAYDRAINKKSIFGISGVVPEALHKTIIAILNHATVFPSTFKTVVKSSMGYFVEAAIQASGSYSSLKKSRSYVLRFYETLCNDQNSDILKDQPIDLICRGLEAILDLIQSSVNLKREDIAICYERALRYFQLCLSLFESERKTLALQLVNWPHQESLAQVIIILLTGFVNIGIEDMELWDLLKQPNKYPKIFLTTFSVFSSYFALSISESLLNYTIENISHAILMAEPQANWIGEESNTMMKSFVSEKIQTFFAKNRTTFSLQNVTLYLYPIEGKVWKPFVETIKNMNYESVKDRDLQNRTYSVGASFANALVNLIQFFPSNLDYNITFIIENFLDWLKDCCSTSKTNPNIIFITLKILGLLFSNDLCVQYLSNESIVDWVMTIQHYLKSTNQQIKALALQLGCKAIYHGLLGSSSILNDDLASNFLASNKELTKTDAKYQLSTINSVELINNIDSKYRASYLFRILIESVYNKKSENLDPIVTGIIELLTQNIRLTDIYNLWPMTLFVKEMRNLNEEAVDRLILELIDSFKKVDQGYGDVLLQFLCDLIVYSSSKKGMEKFVDLPEEYRQNHVLLYLSEYFNNLTYPSYKTNKLDKQFFTNGHHEILQFYDKDKISTNLAVGHFTFQFKQYPELETDEPTIPDANSVMNEPIAIPSPTDHEFQTDLNNSMTSYFKEGLFTPSDFTVQDSNSYSNDNKDEFPDNYSQKLIETPKNYGLIASSFASSAGFNDPISSYRLVPCGFPTFNADINISYKKTIEIGVRSNSETASFKRFKSGLGIQSETDKNLIIYKDCRYELSFIVNSTTKANRIEVFWNQKNPNSFIPKTSARIQISEMDDGYLVETLFNKDVKPPEGLCDAVVSMKSLPAFIIATSLYVHKIVKAKKSFDKYQLAANKLKTVEEENFPQRSQMFSDEKALMFV